MADALRRLNADGGMAFPAISEAVRNQLAKDGLCPECGDELDTGWECTGCGFDAQWLAYPEAQRRIDAMK